VRTEYDTLATSAHNNRLRLTVRILKLHD
jgi:hypothetical protein